MHPPLRPSPAALTYARARSIRPRPSTWSTLHAVNRAAGGNGLMATSSNVASIRRCIKCSPLRSSFSAFAANAPTVHTLPHRIGSSASPAWQIPFSTGSSRASALARSASTSAKIGLDETSEIPRNSVGVQLLPKRLHAQLFPATSDPVPPIDKLALSISKDHLSQHGLKASQAATLPETSFELPALQGKDLAEHFWNIGREVAQPWLGMAHELAALNLVEPPDEEVDDQHARSDDFRFEPAEWIKLDASLRTADHIRPTRWSESPGWTRYPVLRSEDGAAVLGAGVSVPYPDTADDALTFDVETMVSEGPFPVMATAAGKDAWYSWLSPWLVGKGEGRDHKHHLIPLGPNGSDAHPRLVVGHNVSYDRARTLEEYTLQLGNTRWLDTMSLHVATRGISSPQRPAWMQHNKAKAEKRAKKLLQQSQLREETRKAIQNALSGIDYDADELEGLKLEALDQHRDEGSSAAGEDAGGGEAVSFPNDFDLDGSNDTAAANVASKSTSAWLDETSKNSLADVAKLHRVPLRVSKTARDAFIDGTPREEILANVQHLLSYCASDVLATHQIFCKVWNDFAERCPHPATMAGVLHLGSTLLPVDDEWLDYKSRCEQKFHEMNDEVQGCLLQLAEKLKVEGTAGVPWSLAEAISAEKQPPSEDGEARPASPINPDRPRVWWEDDAWYSQLDWSPKKPKKAARLAKSDGTEVERVANDFEVPTWYRDAVVRNKTKSGFGPKSIVAQQLLRLHLGDVPLIRDGKSWSVGSVETSDQSISGNVLGAPSLKKHGAELSSRAGPAGERVLAAVKGEESLDEEEVATLLRQLADEAKIMDAQDAAADLQLSQLDWTLKELRREELMALSREATPEGPDAVVPPLQEPEWWPKWYWDLVKSSTGELAVTIRSAVAPLLLKVSWRGCPLYRSREHGWVYRLDAGAVKDFVTRQKPLTFGLIADAHLQAQILANPPTQTWPKGKGAAKNQPLQLDSGIHFFKVPHSEGEGANVGSPFAKSFIPYFEDGTLKSQHPDEIGQRAARTALDLNAQCSYWIAVRDRVEKQMVVWDSEGGTRMGYGAGVSGARRDRPGEADRAKGIILPQVVSMGTVTRRATENTWLTASNAKKNRLGSELKAMVKAPPGYSLVGADVDSEELWICSVMGDAQFGIHGATAIGWMTLEGTKALGTDLHSKTASILGISRNQAKVFNYSRIYGAGIKHATHLLLKANPSMGNDEATRLAKELYAATKGQNTHTDELFERKFWYGGTESYVFNKLESIALSDRPQTPALDCGVTTALTKKYLGKVDFGNGRMSEEYMPSRINWVVQSSGVDYLHLLITSMEWLCRRYDIDARFMLSVHDEVRYLAKDEDRYRAAMALQIANLWTRAMFAFKLQMDDLPLGCAFFTAVDVDKVLRKEADDPCVTPSHPEPLPVGEALEIQQILDLTQKGSLYADGRAMDTNVPGLASRPFEAVKGRSAYLQPSFPDYAPSLQTHRSTGQRGLNYLQAQASKEMAEIRALEQRAKMAEGKKIESGTAKPAKKAVRTVKKPTAMSEDDWLQSCADEAAADPKRRPTRRSTVGDPPSKTRPARPTVTKATATGEAQRRGLSTSSGTQLASVRGSLAALEADILSLFPPSPPRRRVPFYKTAEHRKRILSDLYRPLLRACPQDLPTLRESLRHRFRSKKSLTSPLLVDELVEAGQDLLRTLLAARDGDAASLRKLRQKERALKKTLHRRRWSRFWERKVHERKYPPRIPHHSGALLPPTLYNRPLPRYKPVQPVAVSMMIFRRRMARIRRAQKLAEIEELKTAQRGDASIMRHVVDARQLDRWQGFDDELFAQRAELSKSFALDTARSRMVFDHKTLVLAKRARIAKKRANIRAKYQAEMQRVSEGARLRIRRKRRRRQSILSPHSDGSGAAATGGN